MLKLKLPYFGHLMQRTDSLGKILMLGKIEGRSEKGMTEDEMVGWHHWLNGYEFEQAPGVSDRQGSLVCCSPRGRKESDTTEQLHFHFLSFPMSQYFTSVRLPWYWSISISTFNEYSGLISFRIDWFDLLGVQGTLNSLLQYHSSKAWILWCSAFFMVQLSHPYMTTRKTIAITRWTFVRKVVSLLFNMRSRFVIAFLPRSKCLLI